MYSAITNFLVLQQLEKVTPNLASEFQQKHKSFSSNSNITLESVVQKFLVDSSVYNHMLEVTPHLANEFLKKNPFVCQNLVSIQTLLTQFQERDNPAKRKATSNHTDSPCKKIKTTSELTQNSVVYHHLSVVTPELANEFKQKHSVMFPIDTSLKELVDQYFKDNVHIQQQEKEIIPSSSPDSIQVIALTDEEVIDVSSSSESSSEEDTDSDEDDEIYFLKEIEKQFVCVVSTSEEDAESDEDDEIYFLKEIEKQFECVVSTSEEDSDSDIIPISQSEEDESEVSVIKNLKPKASSNKMNPLISKSQPNFIDSSKNDVNLTHNPKNVMIDENMNEYRHISESSIYTDLGKTLEKDSVVDKIVLHILNENIQISQLNSDHVILSAGRVMRQKHTSVPSNIELGSFSLQDDNTILSNWNKLVTEMNIDNPEETFKLFTKRPTKEEKLKANVLGLYLSQGMKKLRLAADVFFHSGKILINFVKGNITPSEHDFIMDYIPKHGESPQAFKGCAKLLNRFYPVVIRQYYFKHCENMHKKGPYTVVENKIFISEVMEKSNIKTVLDIKNAHSKEGTVKKETFKEIAAKLGRPVDNIVHHWELSLKPLFLQFHAGTVNFDVRKILINYLLEKKISFVQDIPWDELLMHPQFAGHNKYSLGHIFNQLVRLTKLKYRCKGEEINIEQIASYVNKLNPKFGKQLSGKKQELIDYYRSFIDVKTV